MTPGVLTSALVQLKEDSIGDQRSKWSLENGQASSWPGRRWSYDLCASPKAICFACINPCLRMVVSFHSFQGGWQITLTITAKFPSPHRRRCHSRPAHGSESSRVSLHLTYDTLSLSLLKCLMDLILLDSNTLDMMTPFCRSTLQRPPWWLCPVAWNGCH